MLRISALAIFALSLVSAPLFTYRALHPTDYYAFDRINSATKNGTLSALAWLGLIISGLALQKADRRVKADKRAYFDAEKQRAVLSGIFAVSLVIDVYYGVSALLELRRIYYTDERTTYSIAALFGWFGVVASALQLRKLGTGDAYEPSEQDRRARLYIYQAFCIGWAMLFTLGAATCAHGPHHAGDRTRFHLNFFFVLEAVFAAPGFIGFYFCTRALRKSGQTKHERQGFEVLPPKG